MEEKMHSDIDPPINKKDRTVLNRFIERLKDSFLFFQNKPKNNILLARRIQDMHKTAEIVLQQLITIKERKKEQIEPDFFGFLETIFDPLIKEISRIQKAMHQPTSAAHQAQSFKRYSQWIEKAKTWIQICSKDEDVDSMKKAIVQNTVQDVPRSH